jgi:serine/threonine-protein kinase HipA
MSNSVDNEHYCLQLLAALGLKVSTTKVATFGARKVLVVERFDREWRPDGRLLRLPQEDCCQALGVPPGRKYQSQGGPGVVDISQLLQGSDDPLGDRTAFFKSQILFWLIGATDGHAKNFSVFLRPGGGFSLTPFYDVLSAQPVFDARQIPRNKYKLAMSVGNYRKYSIEDIAGRHFVETAKQAGLGPTLLTRILEEIIGEAETAPARTLDLMPAGFVDVVHHSIVAALPERLRLLEAVLAAV